MSSSEETNDFVRRTLFTGVFSFLTLIPLIFGLFHSTKMSAFVWRDSAKYVQGVRWSGLRRQPAAQDWTCIVAAEHAKNFTALRASFNLPNTSQHLLVEENASFYGSTGFLVFFPAWIITWIWFLGWGNFAWWTKWGKVHSAGEKTAFDTCLHVTGFLTFTALFAAVSFGTNYLLETFTRLIDFAEFAPEAPNAACILSERESWQWNGVPSTIFTDATNAACKMMNCLVRPYANPNWWWIGLTILGVSFLVFAGAAMAYTLNKHKEDVSTSRFIAYYTLVFVPFTVPIAFLLLGLVFAWWTFDILQPQMDFTWSWASFRTASFLFSLQRGVTAVSVTLLAGYQIIRGIEQSCGRKRDDGGNIAQVSGGERPASDLGQKRAGVPASFSSGPRGAKYQMPGDTLATPLLQTV